MLTSNIFWYHFCKELACCCLGTQVTSTEQSLSELQHSAAELGSVEAQLSRLEVLETALQASISEQEARVAELRAVEREAPSAGKTLYAVAT